MNPRSTHILLLFLAACGDDGTGPADSDTARGSMEVTTVSGGADVDGDGYVIQLNGDDVVGIEATDVRTVDSMVVGQYQVGLTQVQGNCVVDGDNPRTVNVVANDESEIQFVVHCQDALVDQVAFFSNRDGNFEIYAMRRDGSAVVRLTNDAADDRGPAVSPDGTRIAFRTDRDGNVEIYAMNADGSDPVNLTNSLADDQHPSWAPDGSRIAFVSDRNGDLEIFVMNADGTGVVNLTNSPGSGEAYPKWSPDGGRLLFVSDRDGNAELYVMNADGTDPANLTNDPGDDTWSTWSPDGSRIAFTTDRTGNFEIFVMDADGSNPLNLTVDDAFDDIPSWSPDGAWIAFASDRNGDGGEVFRMNPAGGDLTNLSHNAAMDAVGPEPWGF
jgi:Tol biopolymer transport system component